MPVGFWNDPGGSKYHDAYFARFPGVWCHGDYMEITPRGSVIIYGRSDAVLNPGGVRIGTAEIYRQVEQLPEVVESLVIGQDWDRDVRVVLFVRLREGLALDEALVKRIKQQIRTNTTPRHVPAKIMPGRRYPAHQERQDRRAGGAQRGARPAGEEPGSAGQPRGAGTVPGPARPAAVRLRGAAQQALRQNRATCKARLCRRLVVISSRGASQQPSGHYG